MQSRGLLLIGLGLVGVGMLGLVLLNSGILTLANPNNAPTQRGAWIFNTGTDPNGQLIGYTNGMMMRTSCADCHGPNGHGLQTPMFVSPNITYRNLTAPEGMLEPNGEHGMKYTDELIRRAVTQGIDAEGKPLLRIMPHWQLTDAEWNDLLAYLKTLP